MLVWLSLASSLSNIVWCACRGYDLSEGRVMMDDTERISFCLILEMVGNTANNRAQVMKVGNAGK